MISSIPGQNERWTQMTALQSPPVAQSGQNGDSGFGSTATTAAGPSTVSPVTGSTASPLSSNMSFMLMMMGGGPDSANVSGPANASGSAIQTVGSPDDTSDQQSGASLVAQLQSFLSSMTGATSAATAASAPLATAWGGATVAPGSGPSPASSPGLPDLNNDAAGLETMVASADATQTVPPTTGGGGSPAKSNGGNDITNTGTAVAARRWGDGPAGAGGGWEQQFLMAAYASGKTSGVNDATMSALQSITV
jgi:hypothetical protein